MNGRWFLSLEDARSKFADWWRYYAERRPECPLSTEECLNGRFNDTGNLYF